MIKNDRYSQSFGEYMQKEVRKQKWIDAVVLGVQLAGGLALAYIFVVMYLSAF